MAIVKNLSQITSIVFYNTDHVTLNIIYKEDDSRIFRLIDIDNPNDIIEISNNFLEVYKNFKRYQVVPSFDGASVVQLYSSEFKIFESKLSDENKLLLEIGE